jgi:hypothetical protein
MHKLQGNKAAQAIFLQTWSSQAYNYTAEVNREVFDNIEVDKSNSPCSEKYCDIDDITIDGQRVLRFCQNHICSGYCLRKITKRTNEKGKRNCRCGAGDEATPGKGNTPGFILRDNPRIVRDKRGFDRIELKRNNNRLVQSSLDLCQSWRGNCDFQILLYESDPYNPEPAEIARVTDYVVAYACKGNHSLAAEKKQIKEAVLRYVHNI